jgi:hypothetical protein
MLTKQQFDKLIPKTVLNVLNLNVWLAGGSLELLVNKDAKIKDYDLFFRHNVNFNEALVDLLKAGCKVEYACPEGELFNLSIPNSSKVVQLINSHYFRSMTDLVDSFDFVCCMAAYNGDSFYCHNNFERCVTNRMLTINRITYPVASFNRMKRYVGKGYKVSETVALQLLESMKVAVSNNVDDNGYVSFDKELAFYPID